MMDEKRNENPEQEQQPRYVPRPAWQVWAARVGLVLFILFLIMYYMNVLRGGA